MKCRQTGCRYCDLDIENFAPYRRGEWRDRGNNTTCPHGPNAGKPHAPFTQSLQQAIRDYSPRAKVQS